MTFTSFLYLPILAIILALFYVIPKKGKILLLLLTSYLFYFQLQQTVLLLLFSQTIIAYYAAIKIASTEGKRKSKYLNFAILANIFILALFKYTNFLLENLFGIFNGLDSTNSQITVDIILPIGISFYTFQIISYLLDVYWEQVEPEINFMRFALFISFFPTIMAGPIERFINIKGQYDFQNPFDKRLFQRGIGLIILGLMYKMVVADRLGMFVDTIFNNYRYHGGLTLSLASFFYSIQVYADFAGYSMIAIGSANLFGLKIIENFNLPYFSQSISEFWNRWHISLSSWLRDYIFIPLGYTRFGTKLLGKYRTNVNIMVTFLISGIWHGANWTFVIWGLLHGLFINIELFFGSLFRKNKTKLRRPSIALTSVKIFGTFCVLTSLWILFRSESLTQAVVIYREILFEPGELFNPSTDILLHCFYGVLILFVIELGRYSKVKIVNYKFRLLIYFLLIFCIILFGVLDKSQFIYFQF